VEDVYVPGFSKTMIKLKHSVMYCQYHDSYRSAHTMFWKRCLVKGREKKVCKHFRKVEHPFWVFNYKEEFKRHGIYES
jgi:hypothetical protein